MDTTALFYLGLMWIACAYAQTECQAGGSDGYQPIPDIERRGVNIQSSSEPVCDSDLTEGWYRIDQDLVVGKVETNLCGTYATAYLTEPIPEIEGETQELGACRNLGFNDADAPCDVPFTINVTNCGPFRVYYLISLECPSAYCINANTSGVANVTDSFPDPVTVTIAMSTTDADTTATPVDSTMTDADTTATPVDSTMTDAGTPPMPTETMTTSSDCEASEYRPWVTGFDGGPFCDIGAADCYQPVVHLLSTSPVRNSSELMCRYREVLIDSTGPLQTEREMTGPAIHVDCYTVICPIPRVMMEATEGPFITGWFVAVSNQNEMYGKEMLYVPFDGQCTWCEFSPEDIPMCHINSSHCYINGKCWPDGAINPDNSCSLCDVTSPSMWSPADDNVCMVNGTCYADGAMANGTTCKVCNISLSTTSFTAADGFCLIDDECFSDMEPNPEDACQVCNSEQSVDAFVAASNMCSIDGNCVAANAVNQDNPCEICSPARNALFYSQRTFELRNGNFIPCPDLCRFLTQTDALFNSVCGLTLSLASQFLRQICTLKYTSDLNDAPCVSQGAAITRYQNVCVHYPDNISAARLASCNK